MAKDIQLTIYDMRGEQFEIEARDDLLATELIKELCTALNIPSVDAGGYSIEYRLDNKDTGRTLDELSTLASQEVRDGHRLVLIRATIAGCFPESARVLLPSGAAVAISSIKSQDTILTFNSYDESYSSNLVQGVYLETYAKQIIINDRLVTTPDQHILLADQTWALVSDISEGDELLEFPFGKSRVVKVERSDTLMPMVSLTLLESLCFIVEGYVVRDFLGKQSVIRRPVDVFLSYSVADRDEARWIFDKLKEKKLSVFMSEKSIEPGHYWEGVIKTALKDCHNFWLLVTRNSLRSEWVITEWASAWALDKTIVPILFRCTPEELPDRLRAYQCVDFHKVDLLIELYTVEK